LHGEYHNCMTVYLRPEIRRVSFPTLGSTEEIVDEKI
jgi:hypothetical protein